MACSHGHVQQSAQAVLDSRALCRYMERRQGFRRRGRNADRSRRYVGEVMRQVRAQTTDARDDAYGAKIPHQLPVAQTRALFKRPRRLRRLGDWAFPTPNHASSATDTDDDNDGSISAFDMAHKSRDDEDNASPIDQTREEQCPEWIDDTDDSSAISRHSCSLPTAVPPRNARERESHAVIKRQATTSESSDEDEQSYLSSKILTQNAHGLRQRVRDDYGNLRPNSPPDYTQYEHLITTMKLKDIDVYLARRLGSKEMSLTRS